MASDSRSVLYSMLPSFLSLYTFLLPGSRTAPNLLHLVLVSSFLPFLFIASSLTSLAFYRAYVPQARWSQTIYLQYGQADNPFGEVAIPSSLIAQGQRYDAFVHLVLPASQANHALGNFMCNLTIISRGSGSLSSARPTIALATPRTVSLWPFPGRHDIVLQIMESVTLSSLSPPLLARLEVGRYDAWRNLGLSREVQTISSEVSLVAVLTGWRWWMYHFPLMSVALSTSLFFLTASIIALISYFSFVPQFASSLDESTPKSPKFTYEATLPSKVPYEPYDKPTRLGTDMGSVSEDISVKAEETESDVGDWSEASLGDDHPIVGESRLGESSRTNSSDSLVTLGGTAASASARASHR